MLEMVNAIPENIGWVIVGAVGVLTLMMGIKVGKMFVQMWKEWHEDETEECAIQA